MGFLAGGYPDTGPLVSCSDHTITNVRSGAACQANFRVDNDGLEYESDNQGNYSASSGQWLDRGLNSEVWVERTVNSGTLDTDTIGGSRVVCSTDRIVGITRGSAGTDTANVTLEFFDAASGGNSLDTATIALSAEFSP